jgi:uncharacterized membrane protein
MHMTWFFGAIFLLMIMAGVALLVIFAVRARPLSPTTHAPMREGPRDILDRRFAAGEISADEYKRSRDLLGGGGNKA